MSDDSMEIDVDRYTRGADTGGSSSSTSARTKPRSAKAKQQQQQQSAAANSSLFVDDDGHDSELDRLLSYEIPGQYTAVHIA
jgi:hypothetical protein